MTIRVEGGAPSPWNTTTAAGAEGPPGGYIGQTATGAFDQNIQNFQMSGPTAVSYQYYWTWPGGGYQNANPAANSWLSSNQSSPYTKLYAAEKTCMNVVGASFSINGNGTYSCTKPN